MSLSEELLPLPEPDGAPFECSFVIWDAQREYPCRRPAVGLYRPSDAEALRAYFAANKGTDWTITGQAVCRNHHELLQLVEPFLSED